MLRRTASGILQPGVKTFFRASPATTQTAAPTVFSTLTLRSAHTSNVPLLQKLGVGQQELQTYLNRYTDTDPRRFGVIKVGGGVIRDQLDELVDSISTLSRFGLIPIVVHGAGPQMNAALKDLKIESRYDDGLRVTTPEVLKVARRIFVEANYRLANALERASCRATPVQSGVFEAKTLDMDRWGYVGEVTSVNVDPLFSAIDNGCVPVLTCMGQAPDGHFLNINADIAARDLTKVVQPKTMVFVSEKGGLFDEKGDILQSIDIAYDYDNLQSRPWYAPGDGLKLKEIKDLMQVMPRGSTVSVTSSGNMAKELLTHSRSGTLVTNSERVDKHHDLEKVDLSTLKHMLETTFGGQLRSNYFDTLGEKLEALYLSELYHAVAVVSKVDGVPYMSKFAVSEEFQMAGLGRRIFRSLEEDFPTLVWRSRNTNPINRWYFDHAQGAFRGKEWTVFWYGLERFGDAERLVNQVMDLPSDIQH